MHSSWQDVLGDFLSYFGDQSIAVGLGEAVVVGIAKESLYQDYVSALEAGIASAARGERDVLRFLRPLMLIEDPAEARAYLEAVLARFRTLYDETVKARAATPWPGDQGGT